MDEESTLGNAPRRWVICDCCQGEGKSSAHLGSFTREQIDEDPDWFEGYMDGEYDRPCMKCKGTGKVHEIDFDRCSPEQQAELDMQAELAQEMVAENRMRSLGYQF